MESAATEPALSDPPRGTARAHLTDAQDQLPIIEQALGQLRESVVVTDAQVDEPGPHIVYVNAAFTRMTGWEMEEAIGRNPRFLQGPKTTRQTLDRLRAQLQKGEAFTGEDINYRKDGSEFYIDWYIEPLRNAQGEIEYFVAVQRDVTDRKTLEVQLLQTQRLEALGLLASGIAHDLNNVFAPILIAPQILREQAPDPRFAELLALVETSARRGVELVKQILVFARGSQDAHGSVQPRHLIEEVAKVAQSTFPKAITITTDAPAETWPVDADATQLYQLLLNLCVNARDAITGTGRIAVLARNLETQASQRLARGELPAGKYVVLHVTDSGSGIAPENLEKLFQPFFTTKAEGQGTGLGLATVAVVLKNARGYLDIETEMGIGTTFSVYLPAAETADRVAPAAPLLPRSLRPRQILLVDDEAAIIGVMRGVLQSAGHNVQTARSGLEAHRLLAGRRFDLALVDLMMPGEELGITARELQAAGLPLIAMSGLADEEVRAQIPGASILLKPFTLTALLAAVEGMDAA